MVPSLNVSFRVDIKAICKIWLKTYGLSVQNPDDTCCATGWKMDIFDECVQELSGWNEMMYSLKNFYLISILDRYLL